MKTVAFDDLVRQFTDDQTPRVWSLLVSLFGELAQERDAQISGTLLGRLTTLMGIRPEAVRVALHRLRKDGWIQSERRGRNSVYALTGWGRAQSAEATPRIYGLAADPQAAWLVLLDPAQPVGVQDTGSIWITPNLLIGTEKPRCSHAFATQLAPEDPLPDWIKDKICTPDVAQLSHGFRLRLKSLQDALVYAGAMDCFETAALRILIVDGWRRILLKTPHLPAHVFPDAWAGLSCRNSVASLLLICPKPPLEDLERAVQ
jgi:phenylacetic acid degradation operon negative regulatory protein